MSIFNIFRNLAASKQNESLDASKIVLRIVIVEKQVSNLRLVGRESDAQKVIHEYFLEIIEQWIKQPENTELVEHLAKASISLDALADGKGLLEIVIEKAMGKLPTDLTTIYTALGCVLHRLATKGDNVACANYRSQELRAYQMATEFVAPANCRLPATREQKAIAHNFAFYCASNMNLVEEAYFHDRKRKELMPERDWDIRKRPVAEIY
jgi:hypothetical protein